MAKYLNMDSVLGIEGGGTKTVALLATGARIQRRQFDALNLKLSTDRQILTLLRQFQPTRAAICLAGCRTTADRNRVHRLAKRAWPKAKVFTGNDLDSGLVAVFGLKQAGILVISGTGSVIVGRSAGGKIGRAGGWGHWLGDHGSGYWLALTGLRAAIRELDRTGQPSTTLRRLLRRLKLTSPEQLVEWIAGATKAEVARHADIFLRGNRGLALQAASFLAMDCAAVVRKLKLTQPAVALAGGVLQNHPAFRSVVIHRIRQTIPGARVKLWRGESALGALRLASA